MKKIKNIKGGLKDLPRVTKKCPLHSNRQVYCRGLCSPCYNKWLRDNNPEFKQKQIENNKKWIKANRERKKELDKQYRLKQDKEYSHYKTCKLYGITPDEYNILANKNNHRCWICNRETKEGKHLHIDHCHETGQIRGLLCFRCNYGLSYFNENANFLLNASNYIKNGENIHNELEKIVDQKQKKLDLEKEKLQEIFANAKTKEIPDQEKQIMRKLAESGWTISELEDKFPQYSHGAIARTVKGLNRNHKYSRWKNKE